MIILSQARTTKELTKSILERADERNDVWGKKVARRLRPMTDAVAEEVVYHQKCFPLFWKNKYKPSDERENEICAAMDYIYSFLENADECQFSMEEIVGNIKG